jgi:hypothetical protein
MVLFDVLVHGSENTKKKKHNKNVLLATTRGRIEKPKESNYQDSVK